MEDLALEHGGNTASNAKLYLNRQKLKNLKSPLVLGDEFSYLMTNPYLKLYPVYSCRPCLSQFCICFEVHPWKKLIDRKVTNRYISQWMKEWNFIPFIKNLVTISGWNGSYLLGTKHTISGCRFLINEGSYVRVFTVCKSAFSSVQFSFIFSIPLHTIDLN